MGRSFYPLLELQMRFLIEKTCKRATQTRGIPLSNSANQRQVSRATDMATDGRPMRSKDAQTCDQQNVTKDRYTTPYKQQEKEKESVLSRLSPRRAPDGRNRRRKEPVRQGLAENLTKGHSPQALLCTDFDILKRMLNNNT